MAGVTPYTENSWKKTRADRIRAMTDEELARWIASRKETCPPINGYKCSIMTCGECWLDYLKQEVSANDS